MADVRYCDHMQSHESMHSTRVSTAANDDGTKRIALTFDDGPSGSSSTEEILALLDKYGIKATFFLVGQMIDANPDKVTAEFNAGHLIENHSRTHPEFSTLSRDQMVDELDTVTAQIRDLGIPQPQYFRPPYGDGDGSTLTALLEERGLTAVYWNIDSRDWEIHDVDTVHQNVLSDLQSAWDASRLTNVILFHDIQPHTPSVVDLLIPDLQNAGCQFVLIDAIA